MKKAKFINKTNKIFLEGIAHRGLHNDNFTENGLNAFKNAIDHNFAFELDIHLCKSRELVVCHDSNLKRTTGKEGIIEELSLKDIKNNYHLLDGSEIPTLKEVLDLNNNKVPIVIELKAYKGNAKKIGKTLVNELKNYKYKTNLILISFDPFALYYSRKLKILNSLLVTIDHKWTLIFRYLFNSLDIDYKLLNDKKVVRYSKKHFLNVWTIDSMEKFEKSIKIADTLTFQHLDTDLIKKEMRIKNKNYL